MPQVRHASTAFARHRALPDKMSAEENASTSKPTTTTAAHVASNVRPDKPVSTGSARPHVHWDKRHAAACA